MPFNDKNIMSLVDKVLDTWEGWKYHEDENKEKRIEDIIKGSHLNCKGPIPREPPKLRNP